MVFLQPAEGTLAPSATPVNSPRAAAAEASAMRSAISGMPHGSWVTGGGHTKAQDRRALHMMSFGGHDTSAVPMATTLDDTAASYVSYDASSKLHATHTLSSQNHVKGSTSGIGAGRDTTIGGSNRSPRRSAIRRPHSSMGHRPSTKLLDGSVHTSDAACCGYRNLEEHQMHHQKVKGLYVTFCQNSMESQLANASRQLACENESRLVEEEYHRHKLAALVHENDKLKAQHAEWKEKVEKWDEQAAKKNHEHIVLKEEYEKKWREEVELSSKLRIATSEAVEEAEKLKLADGGHRYRIQELEQEVLNVQATLRRAEDQARDNAKRAKDIFDEKEVVRAKSDDQHTYIQNLEEKLRTKEAVVVGLEKELTRANEKLSSVAFFRETFASGKRKAQPRSTSASSPAGGMHGGAASGSFNAQTKDRLYKRYFGRMG